MRHLLNIPEPRDPPPAPTEEVETPTCLTHNVPLENSDDVIMTCPVENCGQFEKQLDLRGRFATWNHWCSDCNWNYPTPLENSCVICNQNGARDILEQKIREIRGE